VAAVATALAVAGVLVGGAVLAGTRLLNTTAPAATGPDEGCVATTDAGTAALASDQAANAALIAAVGQAMGMSPRAVTIALATAMQESKLRNLDYGDLDSLGLFQQRPSQGWGTPEEVMDPIYAAGKFYSALAQVEGFESMAVTDAAQAVQRSAFPNAYAQHEAAARSLASALTGHSAAALTCVYAVAEERGAATRVVAALRAEWGDAAADAVLAAAESATGGAVEFRAASDTTAWARAQWAVAKAKELGIRSVTVAGQTWRRDAGEWTASDSTAPADPLVVTLALA
jgi:hypothetical protein